MRNIAEKVDSRLRGNDDEGSAIRRIGKARAAIERHHLRRADPKGQSFGGVVLVQHNLGDAPHRAQTLNNGAGRVAERPMLVSRHGQARRRRDLQ